FYPVLFLFFCFHFCSAGNAIVPANDDPCNPYDLGLLDTATACPFSSIISPTILANQNNTGATPEFPQPALLNCLGTVDMPSAMCDLWYKFIPTASSLDIYVIGTGTNPLNTPVIALYQYTGNCLALIPIRCARGSSGIVNANF